MSESIEYGADFSHPFDAVYTAMTSKDSIQQVVNQFGGGGAKLLDYAGDASNLTYKAEVTIKSDSLPWLARHLHPGDLVVNLTQKWVKTGADTAAGTVSAALSDQDGDPVTANTSLQAAGEHTSWLVKGTVSVDGIMGGKVAKLIADQVHDLLGSEAGYLQLLLNKAA
ncbi:DUF2505 domain-containing protein [Amycolatopsis sp. DSM 110486]|uniref:DUF2505 domain-containing protein n=1 Tax=Amycolatopsis sp. DSM 110486 TaxID=2865832 RepID=UPI001C6A653B|nr:DUF2505 domain-containing protein [Amycolatopsis sp. DSM 110486]QYN17627.1 DUF2505 domain-containing protein [Amycolatopsis sp. DSM 110486]